MTINIPTTAKFDGAPELVSVELRANLRGIGKLACLQCESLRNIAIPSRVNSLATSAFHRCKKLQEKSNDSDPDKNPDTNTDLMICQSKLCWISIPPMLWLPTTPRTKVLYAKPSCQHTRATVHCRWFWHDFISYSCNVCQTEPCCFQGPRECFDAKIFLGELTDGLFVSKSRTEYSKTYQNCHWTYHRTPTSVASF